MKVLLVISIILSCISSEVAAQKREVVKYSRDSILCKPQKHPLGHKMWKATKIILVADVATMGILAVLPPEFSNWNKDFFKESFKTLGKTFVSLPVWDNDNAYVNYIGHPVGGALYYNMLRAQGATQKQSFLFAVMQSTFYEYVIEAIAERASIQDLITTPVGGYILGELGHKATFAMRKNGFTLIEKIAVCIVNPAYVLHNGFKIDRPCRVFQ